MMHESNFQILEVAAASLRQLLDEVVFVGGATLSLFVTDEGAAPIRATVDVDVIAEITTHMQYFDFSERLRACGFREDDSQQPLNCRWLRGSLILDVMPVESGILLGSVNRWYKDALANAQKAILPSGVKIRAITAPYFLGTKIEAFRGRGEMAFIAAATWKTLSLSWTAATLFWRRLQSAKRIYASILLKPQKSFCRKRVSSTTHYPAICCRMKRTSKGYQTSCGSSGKLQDGKPKPFL